MYTIGENNRLTLRDLLGQYPIQSGILCNLDTGSILNLCKTSWSMRSDIYTYLWDINKKLERFFENPRAFRTELGRADALISGSFALQFFANKYWPESDLDINLRDGKGVDRLGEYLIEAEGYELASDQDIESYKYSERESAGFGYRLGDIITYIKHTGTNDSPLSATTKTKVQLIVTENLPVKAILNGYYTSCIMNFISWNKAYCIFPRATLLFGETVTLKGPQDHNVELHKKYSRRGWRLRTASVFMDPYQLVILDFRRANESKDKKQNNLSRFYPLGTGTLDDRRVGGNDTWTMKLSIAGVEPPLQPDSVLEYSSFKIFGGNNPAYDEDGTGIRIRANLLESHSLRYQYTFGDPTINWKCVCAMLTRNTRGQVRTKMTQEEAKGILEPPNGASLCDIKFDKPVGWDFWDDCLPEALDAFRVDSRCLKLDDITI
ncbi:hypothetical protein F4859DRAFT_526926 [Xylaria cf. heliscus]|nr:hypothetical protein F4859DRAFT_526926 [Xylaria cf. heliscus]